MNILFIKFLLMFLASLGVFSALIWAVVKKKLVLRDLYASLIFTLGMSILVFTGLLSTSLNNQLSMEFKVAPELVSKVNYKDSTVNDTILYDMIVKLRIPHGRIVFAQAKLESNSYKSELYRTNFNLFGMKYVTIRPSVSYNETRGYQDYANFKESLIDYLIWEFSNNVDKLSDERYFEYLHAVYAEDPMYIPKLKNIIKNTNFEKLLK